MLNNDYKCIYDVSGQVELTLKHILAWSLSHILIKSMKTQLVWHFDMNAQESLKSDIYSVITYLI